MRTIELGDIVTSFDIFGDKHRNRMRLSNPIELLMEIQVNKLRTGKQLRFTADKMPTHSHTNKQKEKKHPPAPYIKDKKEFNEHM